MRLIERIPDAARPLPVRVRVALGALLLLGGIAVPVTTVRACSCALLEGGFEGLVEQAEVAFVGTVTASADAGAAPVGFGNEVRYAFAVERASRPTAASVEIRALEDDGGSMCGFSFEVGDRWLVTGYQEAGTLHTSLCSGNQRMDTLAPEQVAAVSEALPFEPSSGEEVESSLAVPIPLLVAALGAGLIAVVMLVAFRRERAS
jgi:hypothetical protein